MFTLGPPSAEDVLREAIAWGADDGVLITDPAFAGSDTLATARALAAALEREGPFDLVLVGRNSVDADTGQVGPEAAQILDLPFVTGVRELEMHEDHLWARLEQDDEWVTANVALPAFLSVAERLCDPCKMPPEGGQRCPPTGSVRSRRPSSALDRGVRGEPTTWGTSASSRSTASTWSSRGSVEEQVAKAVEVLASRGALHPWAPDDDRPRPRRGRVGNVVVVIVEPGRERLTRELLGEAAGLAARGGGRVVAVGPDLPSGRDLSCWGADEAFQVVGARVEEDVAAAIAGWASGRELWGILAPGTAWGREVAARLAASLGAGLTGDAVDLAVEDGRLVAFKPAFGGRLVAAIRADSPIQMATVRPGVLPVREPRPPGSLDHRLIEVEAGSGHVLERSREDDVELLANAEVVVGVGMGLEPGDYEDLQPLLGALSAELAATRKVTDRGWLPQAQVGITGHSISPALRLDRCQRQVQPHGRSARRWHRSRHQPRSRLLRARVRRRQRHR